MRKKTLVLLALTASVSMGLSACGGDENDGVTYTTAPSNTPSTSTDSEQPAEAEIPTDFADETAQTALAEVCDALDAAAVAELLGLPEVKVEAGITEAQDSMSKDRAYCLFDAPEADTGAVQGTDGQTFLSISVQGPAVKASTGGLGGAVKFADGSTGYYNDTTLLVTPTGSPYEFAFDVVLPYEVTTASGLDFETSELWRTKAAEAAGGALN